MILFLSASFLRRLRLNWKPDLRVLLVGQRNMHFFSPDSFTEVAEIDEKTIGNFLEKISAVEELELLGTLSPDSTFPVAGLVQVCTGSKPDPSSWKALVYLMEGETLTPKTVSVQQSGANPA